MVYQLQHRLEERERERETLSSRSQVKKPRDLILIRSRNYVIFILSIISESTFNNISQLINGIKAI